MECQSIIGLDFYAASNKGIITTANKIYFIKPPNHHCRVEGAVQHNENKLKCN